MTMVPATSWYQAATPDALTGTPSSASMRSAGPLMARPPTIGEMATTCFCRAARRSRRPGSARIGPIDTTGLDGATTIAAAVSISSSTPGAGVAWSMPANRTPVIATL